MSKKSKCPLSKEEVLCEACYCILIKPVTFPCKHSFCFDCLKNTFKENALNCPKCRQRIGGWFRKATMKGNEPINETFWAQIQSQFPEEVATRLNGEDDGIYKSIMNKERPAVVQISEPGEVYNEFQSLEKQFLEEARQLREKEALENEEYAKQLQKEEEERAAAERQSRELKELEDAEIARKLQERISPDPTSSRHLPDSSFMPGGFAVSTPTNNSSKAVKSRFSFGSRRSLLADSSASSSFSEKTTAIVGPLDSFVRPKNKNSGSNRKGNLNQLSVSSILLERSPERRTTKITADPKKFWKIAYTPPDGYELGEEVSPKKAGSHFRPIRPSPLTPTKNSPGKEVITPQTMKPSSSKNLFGKTASDSTSLKPIPSSVPFSKGKCAFAPTSTTNRQSTAKDTSDSETDFEDSVEDINDSGAVLTLPKPSETTASSIAEMKELEDYVVRSYSNQPEESVDSNLVNFYKKSNNQLQPIDIQSNRFSLSPETQERYKQIQADYELALQLQEKENVSLKQPVESNYELRKRAAASSFLAGNSSKKQRLDQKSGFKTKQKTIEEAFQSKF